MKRHANPKCPLAALLLVLACAPAWASTITDTIYNQDGVTPFVGALTITNPPFVTAGGKAISARQMTVSVTAGTLSITLERTDNGTPANVSYRVQYETADATLPGGARRWFETWTVTADGTLTVADVRTAVVPSTLVKFGLGQVLCPTCDEDDRPAWDATAGLFVPRPAGGAGGGITTLNGLNPVTQLFAVGTTGSDFGISSSGSTHTFNLPTASASNRGALSSANWSTFNAKEPPISVGTTSQFWRGDKTFTQVPFSALSGSIDPSQTPEGAITQHEAALAIDWGQLTSVPSTFAPSAHALVDHTASGLTTGHVVRANGTTTFAWSALLDGDLPATIARDSEVTAAIDAHAGDGEAHGTFAGSASDGGPALAVAADSVGTQGLDDGTDTPSSGHYVRVDTDDQAGFEYRTTAEVLSDIGGESETHATEHENGGNDEVSIAGLAGQAADPQPTTGALIGDEHAGTDVTTDLEEESHASEHQHGGADEVATATSAANAIPKADGSGDLDDAWFPASITRDSELTAYLALAGGVMTGPLDIDNNQRLRQYEPDGNGTNYFEWVHGNVDRTTDISISTENITGPCAGANGGALTLNGAAPNLTLDCEDDDGGAGGSGEANTGSNLGAGVGVFEGKSSVDLQFNSLVSANNRLTIAEDDGNDEIDFTIVEANFDLANLGGTLGVEQAAAGFRLESEEHAGTDPTADLEEESHATEHQHGGADEVATATSGANAIPKADGSGDLDDAWFPASITRDSEVTADIGAHAAIAAAHHTKTVDASELSAGTLADARVAESNVTQHQAALAVIESQISDLVHTIDTTLTQEEIEDFVGALLEAVTGTHTGITITYQDATGDIDFVVGGLTATELGTDSVSADELNAPGVEAELEAVLDLGDLQNRAHSDLTGIGTSDHHVRGLPLDGGTMTAEFTADALGIEFEPGDALTDCATFAATGGGIFYDDSEGVLKKCQDNVLSVLDTTGGAPATADISDVSVTQTELAELETIDATTISANQWAVLGGIAETLTSTELNLLDGITVLSGSNTGDDDVPESGDFGNAADLESTGALSDDVVAAAEMADADHGDVSWSGGVASIDAGVVTVEKLENDAKTYHDCQTLVDFGTAIPATADIPSLWGEFPFAMTIIKVWCEVDANTMTINLQRDDGSPADILSSDLVCDTSEQDSCASGCDVDTIDGDEDDVAVGEQIDFVIASTGTVNRVNVCVTGIIQ